MPRKKATLIAAAHRVAEARRIVANQHGLIARLKASGHSTVDAEGTLRMYISACKHLEDHEQKVRTEGKAKKRETKKPRSS
jgi:hypothetical protein